MTDETGHDDVAPIEINERSGDIQVKHRPYMAGWWVIDGPWEPPKTRVIATFETVGDALAFVRASSSAAGRPAAGLNDDVVSYAFRAAKAKGRAIAEKDRLEKEKIRATGARVRGGRVKGTGILDLAAGILGVHVSTLSRFIQQKAGV